VTLASATRNSSLEDRFRSEGMTLATLGMPPGSAADADATMACAAAEHAQWVVLDGYAFGTEFQNRVKAGSWPVLMLDDFVQADQFSVTVLLNQNLHANAEAYAGRTPGARLLLGNRYTLLRREFWPWRAKARMHSGRIQRILVTLGGGDAHNVTGTVLEALLPMVEPPLEVVVVVGANNRHWPRLLDVSKGAKTGVHLERNVEDMTPLLASSDLAICGGGATCWELAFLGIPTLSVILATNQRPIAESLAAAGASVDLGWYSSLQQARVREEVQALCHTPHQLLSMSERGRQLVDGWGVERVLDALLEQSDLAR